MINFVKSLARKILSLDLLEESKNMQKIAEKNIKATNTMLQMNGEERWMLKMCKDEGGKDECYPNK